MDSDEGAKLGRAQNKQINKQSPASTHTQTDVLWLYLIQINMWMQTHIQILKCENLQTDGCVVIALHPSSFSPFKIFGILYSTH